MITDICPICIVVCRHCAVLLLGMVSLQISKYLEKFENIKKIGNLSTFISLMISFLEDTVKFVFFFFLQSMKLSSGKEYLPLSNWGQKNC